MRGVTVVACTPPVVQLSGNKQSLNSNQVAVVPSHSIIL
jgi:hypothetical protein